MATKKFDIVIVGAGLIGSALALALVRASTRKGKSLQVAVVERSSQLQLNEMPNQRVIALGKVASDLLTSVGVFDQLTTAFSNPYERMFIWDENSNGELEFSAEEHKLPLLGYMVDSVQCTLLLQREVEQTEGITTYYQSDALCFSRTNRSIAELTLPDVRLQAPIMIAADGASSWLRKQAKIFANHHSYHQRGIVAKISTEEPHQNTAWQRFLSEGPLALLPVEKNQSSIVWSVSNHQATELMNLSQVAFEQRLTQALGKKLGKVSLLSQRLSFPLTSQQAQSYFVRNVGLVGDAAHSIHPLAGQGANLGFKDVVALVHILTDESVTSLSDVRLLHRYQKLRKADNQQTDIVMTALHYAYRESMPAWLAVRGVGMNAVDRSKALKAIFVNQAIGL